MGNQKTRVPASALDETAARKARSRMPPPGQAHLPGPIALSPQTAGSLLRLADVIALQRSVGNRATAALLQRHSGPTIMKPGSKVVGTGQTSVDPGKRKTAVEGILDDSALGKAAKKTAKDYSLNLNWAGPAGGGSYFQEPLDVVFDVNDSDEDTALGYVHEMNHARQYHLGLANDINSARDVYLANEFKEETEGTVQAIEAKAEINATAKKAAHFWQSPKKLAASFAFETEFNTAYAEAVKKAGKGTSAADKAKLGRKAGYDVIYTAFMDGTIKTSMPGNPSYVDWYGKMWDDYALAKASAVVTPTPSTATPDAGPSVTPDATPTPVPIGA